jgi:hypothetical protein
MGFSQRDDNIKNAEEAGQIEYVIITNDRLLKVYKKSLKYEKSNRT